MIRNDHCPVGLHREDPCHDVDGCDCDCGLGHLRLRRAENYFDDLDRDHCRDRHLGCDLDCDLGRDHCFDHDCDFGRDHCHDPNLLGARLHDVHLEQPVFLRVRLIQFPNRQEVRHLHQARLEQQPEQRSLQQHAKQAWPQPVLVLQALFAQGSCR